MGKYCINVKYLFEKTSLFVLILYNIIYSNLNINNNDGNDLLGYNT